MCEGPSKLAIHKRLHATEKAFRCGECPFATQWEGALRKHALRHRAAGAAGGVPCLVPGCGYSAVTRHHLLVHSRKHTCERPFACGAVGCLYAATTKSNLNCHRRKRHLAAAAPP